MFFIGKQVAGQLMFGHHELKSLGDPDFIMVRLKESFEGRCMEELGYIIQLIKQKEVPGGVRIGPIKVTEKGCLALLYFDCICFKRTPSSMQPKKATSWTSSSAQSTTKWYEAG